MNERIEKFALQAKEYADTKYSKLVSTTRWGDRVPSIRELYTEKLAELIVRECVDEIKTLRGKYDTHRDAEPEENDWYVDAFLQAEVRLKEHFGVE